MLISKLNEEGWAALSEAEQKHYTKDATGAYILQHDEAVTLKRALNTERTRADRGEKLLKALLPDLPEDKSEWESVVAEQAETLKELRTVDLDEWKAHKAEPGDPKKGKADWEAERLDLTKQLRETGRDRDAHKKDLEKAATKAAVLASENLSLAQEKALNAALDEAKIVDPGDRKVVTALMLMNGLEPQEVTGKGRVFFVKDANGSEIELGESVKDFVGTEQGKKYVKAPDSSGAGDGTPAPVRPVDGKTFDTMTPSQQLAAALGPGVAGQPPAAGAR